MTITISATELRKRLFALLLKLEEKPNTIIRIIKHHKVVGEISAPSFLEKKELIRKKKLRALLKLRGKIQLSQKDLKMMRLR